MKRKSYTCTGCKQTFTRKHNAERHNKAVHNEMAIVYDDRTSWVLGKRTTPISNTAGTQFEDSNNKMSIGKNADGFGVNAFKTSYLDSSVGKDNSNEEKILKIQGKMLPLIEELDRLLSDLPPIKG